MRRNKLILQFHPSQGIPQKTLGQAFFAKLTKPPLPSLKFIPIACLLFFVAVSAKAANVPGRWLREIGLLNEFRPIGGSGNNLENPDLDVVPGAPEIALAALNFAS